VIRSLLPRVGIVLALCCAIAAVMCGVGYRMGWWPLSIGFGILEYAAIGAIAATVIGVAGVIVTRSGTARRGFALSVAAVLVGMATFSGPVWMLYQAKRLPPIHDITTDTSNPPAFVAVLPLRAGASNSADYG